MRESALRVVCRFRSFLCSLAAAALFLVPTFGAAQDASQRGLALATQAPFRSRYARNPLAGIHS